MVKSMEVPEGEKNLKPKDKQGSSNLEQREPIM